MENSSVRAQTSENLPGMEVTASDPNDRAETRSDQLRKEAFEPMRELETQLGLEKGFLDIKERGRPQGNPPETFPPPSRKYEPAPYYPEPEPPPQNRRPLPIPVPVPVPDCRTTNNCQPDWERPTQTYYPSPEPRTYHQQDWWQRHQTPDRYDRDWRQPYQPSPGPRNWHQQQWWQQHQNPGTNYSPDRRGQDQWRQQEEWRRQEALRRQEELRRQQDRRYPDPRQEDRRYPDPRQQDAEWQRQQEWRRQQQEQQERAEWERQQIERQRRQQPTDRNQGIDPRLEGSIQSFLGKKVSSYDRSVPDKLGCARAVSLVLEKAYGFNGKSQATDHLDDQLLRQGWVQVNTNDLREGDVIIGRRQNRPGHAAIYVGNNRIFNNDSNALKMQIDSLDKFRNPEFVQIKAFRRAR